MSKIPFNFTAIPEYFRDHGWMRNPNMCAFIFWAFSRCHIEKRTIYHIQKAIELDPFEFIFGRRICSEETGLTERQVRTCICQLNATPFGEILKKTTSKTTNKFTVYKWSLEVFCKNNNQQNDQQTTSRRPADDHNQDDKKTIPKEDHQPLSPSSSTDGFDDSFHSFEEKEETPRIEVYPGVLLTQAELDVCIKIKGSLEAVKYAVEYVIRSPGRKTQIRDWVNVMQTWKIKNSIVPRITEHEEMASRLAEQYPDFPSGNGWSCRVYNDTKKDQKGLLFESQSPYVSGAFYAFTDPEFKQKASKFLRDKNMQKAYIPNP